MSKYKIGWRVIGGQRIHARSAWEANYARFLEWNRSIGCIEKWEHEPETFWFHKIKRGVRSYLPDFRVTKLDRSIEYHEVKGRLDTRSFTKIMRMKRYYPAVKLVIIDPVEYREIERTTGRNLPGWET